MLMCKFRWSVETQIDSYIITVLLQRRKEVIDECIHSIESMQFIVVCEWDNCTTIINTEQVVIAD